MSVGAKPRNRAAERAARWQGFKQRRWFITCVEKMRTGHIFAGRIKIHNNLHFVQNHTGT